MSKYYGDFSAGKTVRVRFNTHQSDGTPITLAGTPAVSVYDDTDTQTTDGVTLTVDYDSTTGHHMVEIDTSANGTFYAAGTDFDVVITTGTVDGISVVGTVIGSFSIANRSALRPTTADRTLDVTSTGEAGIDWANVGSPTATVNLSGTTIQAAGIRTAVGLATANLDTQLNWLTTAVGNLPTTSLDAAGVRSAVGLASANLDTQLTTGLRSTIGMASANLDTQLAGLPTNAELATAIIAGLTTALTEGYRATNATGSVRDLLYEILQNITEFAISGTAKTVKKLDGSTTAKTYTLDSSSAPTSITETS